MEALKDIGITVREEMGQFLLLDAKDSLEMFSQKFDLVVTDGHDESIWESWESWKYENN
ncbi:hypothetical protein [Paenibacillus aestuarii]|uniref:Uncharacterized protein n=1 Tax=Paenibacillus aestuarii TaxID=516965 RepID=A0ABW0KEI7_9BACL|nr:hypothetical protein [Paenibacillus aestuarii]